MIERLTLLHALRTTKRAIRAAETHGLLQEITPSETCRKNNPHHFHIWQTTRPLTVEITDAERGRLITTKTIYIMLGHPCGIITAVGQNHTNHGYPEHIKEIAIHSSIFSFLQRQLIFKLGK